MIRVLQELSALDGGGVAKLLFEYYRHMDRSRIQFDFLIYDFYKEGIYEKPLKEMGASIYKLPIYAKNPDECTRLRNEIIRTGNYDVVHSHMGMGAFRILRIAAKYRVPKRIAHSHIAYEPYPFKTKIFNHVKRMLIRHYATDLFACGRDAGSFMWGAGSMAAGRVKIMPNAIDTDLYRFCSTERECIRRELGIAHSTYVIGIVGRLSEQKNYPFLFQVYREVVKKRQDVILLVVGRGLEEDEIKAYARQLELEKYIRFLGVRNDVPRLLNAFDVFVLPSKYEGLPVVLVEAQANGVRELVSDKVTKEMAVTDLITYLSIENGSINRWAEQLCEGVSSTSHREEYAEKVKHSGYDINVASKQLENFYIS